MANLSIMRKGRRSKPLTIPESGLRFGRHHLNDLVLKDKKMPLFHGRIYFQEDGSLWLNNFTNDDLIKVNGVATTSKRLNKGEIIKLANLSIHVNEDQQNLLPTAPATASMRPATNRKTDATSRRQTTSTPNNPARQLKRGIPASAIILYLLMLTAIGGYLGRDYLIPLVMPTPEIAAPSLALEYVKKESLVLLYQQLRGDADHMIRYSLELSENGVLSVQIYDLLTDHIIERSVLISQEKVADLAKKVLKTGFFKAPSESASASSAQGEYTIFNIILKRDNQYHEAKVFNNILPVYIKNVVQLLENTAASELDVPITWKLSNKQLLDCLMVHGEEEDIIPSESASYYERLHASTRQLKDAENYLQTLDNYPLWDEVMKAQKFVLAKLANSYNGPALNKNSSAKEETPPKNNKLSLL
jgi:hypothetical protein